MYAIPRDVEQAFDVLCCTLADGYYLVLAPGQIPCHNTTVEHPCVIGFSPYMELGKIMDRGYQCTGSRPQHTPVARDMEDIDVIIFQPFRQRQLVPQDISNRCPILFASDDEMHC